MYAPIKYTSSETFLNIDSSSGFCFEYIQLSKVSILSAVILSRLGLFDNTLGTSGRFNVEKNGVPEFSFAAPLYFNWFLKFKTY